MKKTFAAATPDAYLAALSGWRRELVVKLRALALAEGTLEEVIKWHHLVYFSQGPVLLIRAEEARVLFGFWRGQRLRDLDSRLKPGGKYEMATIVFTEKVFTEKVFTENGQFSAAQIKKLIKTAVALNQELGDPTVISTKKPPK